MRISDWSSDVCSSDLCAIPASPAATGVRGDPELLRGGGPVNGAPGDQIPSPQPRAAARRGGAIQAGDPRRFAFRHRQDRKSVVSGKSVSVRVYLGGRRHITKKITQQNITQKKQ